MRNGSKSKGVTLKRSLGQTLSVGVSVLHARCELFTKLLSFGFPPKNHSLKGFIERNVSQLSRSDSSQAKFRSKNGHPLFGLKFR